MDDVYRQAGFTPIHVLEYDLDNRPDETISALLRTVGERLRDCGVWRPVKDDQDVLNADLIAQMARIKKRRERTGVLAAPKAKYQYTCVSCGRRIYTHCEKCARNVKYRCSHCRK